MHLSQTLSSSPASSYRSSSFTSINAPIAPVPLPACIPFPSVQSLAHRASFAQAFTALKRIRPRVPFWTLPAHRIPTLWSLYRGLLRDAPGNDIRWRMSMYFRKYRNLTSPKKTREKLQNAHRWFDMFQKAKAGDVHLQNVLARYGRLIAVKREKEEMKAMLREEFRWQQFLRTKRAILTGGYLRATRYNRPLPRMKPQPIHVGAMIRKRVLAKSRRGIKYNVLKSWLEDVTFERTFEKVLAKTDRKARFEQAFGSKEWDRSLIEQRTQIRQSLVLEGERERTPYSPEMLKAIADARLEKIRNKTRERKRERQGEVLKRTIKRRNKGPPAYILQTMTPRERAEDKAMRGVSEVGYVGMLKRRRGFKVVDDKRWRREDGRKEHREQLDKIGRELRKVNEAKRNLAKMEAGIGGS